MHNTLTDATIYTHLHKDTMLVCTLCLSLNVTIFCSRRIVPRHFFFAEFSEHKSIADGWCVSGCTFSTHQTIWHAAKLKLACLTQIVTKVLLEPSCTVWHEPVRLLNSHTGGHVNWLGVRIWCCCRPPRTWGGKNLSNRDFHIWTTADSFLLSFQYMFLCRIDHLKPFTYFSQPPAAKGKCSKRNFDFHAFCMLF